MSAATGRGDTPPPGTVQGDLVEMLEAARAAERGIFGLLEPARRDAPRTIGEWSAKDLLAHLAAWRAVEVDRLRTGWRDRPTDQDGGAGGADGDDSDDVANARIQAERGGWSWAQVQASAESSIDDLEAAIADTSAEALERSEHLVAGIGANGANHALAHLADASCLAGPAAAPVFAAFEGRIEAILRRGRIPDRDAGVMIYNLACNAALAGRPDDARRMVAEALRLRPDLIPWAHEDPDLASIRSDLPAPDSA